MAHIVYRLRNFTKKEIYFGTTEKTLRERLKEHESGGTKVIEHWNWGKDDIAPQTMAKNLSDKKATEAAHKFESGKPPKGWKIMQTAGK